MKLFDASTEDTRDTASCEGALQCVEIGVLAFESKETQRKQQEIERLEIKRQSEEIIRKQLEEEHLLKMKVQKALLINMYAKGTNPVTPSEQEDPYDADDEYEGAAILGTKTYRS